MKILAICLVAVLFVSVSARLNPDLAKTPPMGFNTWNYFAQGIDEKVIKETADAFV